MSKKVSRFRQLRASALALLDESATPWGDKISHWRRCVHFWVLVWRSFSRNRCPIRASALAYATLLALIPMLAVVMSITSSFLKQEGEQRIDQFIVKLVANLTPPATLSTNASETIDAQPSVGTTATAEANLETNRTA